MKTMVHLEDIARKIYIYFIHVLYMYELFKCLTYQNQPCLLQECRNVLTPYKYNQPLELTADRTKVITKVHVINNVPVNSSRETLDSYY